MLDVVDLTVAYGPMEAVRGVSLQIEEGAIVTLIGPNGAGKTSILDTISGVVPARSGQILFHGRDITRMSAHRRVSLGVIHVPEGRQVLAGMTVRENLELGGYRRPLRDVVKDVARMEERFPILGERSHMAAGALSGGEQQMLAIARGLMARPKLLLLDEPSLGLAPMMVKTVFDIIRQVHDEGVTILLVEQNAHLALATSSHAFVIESGKIVLDGPAEVLRSDASVISTYLGQAI
jgi:branched-chain amino acid transport system ATP-binding protein